MELSESLLRKFYTENKMYPTYNEKNYERFCGIVIGVAKKLCCVQKGFRRQYGTQTANKFIAELNNARKDKYSL